MLCEKVKLMCIDLGFMVHDSLSLEFYDFAFAFSRCSNFISLLFARQCEKEPCRSFHSLTYIHSSIHCKSFIFVCVAIWHDYSQCLQFYNLLHFEIFDRREFWVDSVIKYTRLSIFVYLFFFCCCCCFVFFFLSFSIVVNFIWAIQGMSYKVFHGIIYCIGRVCEKHKTNIG